MTDTILQSIKTRLDKLEQTMGRLEQQNDSMENKLDSIITGQVGTETEVPKRKITPAITSRLKNEILTPEGKLLFQHMTRGPDKDWDKRRDLDLVVKYEDFLAKVVSNVTQKNQIIIELFARIDEKGEEEEISLEKKTVSNNSLTVPSLWKFDLVEDALDESLGRDTKVRNSITKVPADQKIRLKINHLWQKVMVGDRYDMERKWLRKWVDDRTLTQPKGSPAAKPTPKKSREKKASVSGTQPTPKKSGEKKVSPTNSASDVDASSEDEE